MTADTIISLRGVTNSFGSRVIHQDLDLDIRRGEILGLIGGSGTGKSVLLRSMLWLRPPQQGTITVLGCSLRTASAEEWRRIRRQWGVLFQNGALFSSLTLSENVQVPLKEFTRLSPTLAREIAALKISLVGLPPEAADLYPSELSGGMRKRAGLARALALDPPIVFLDEPTAGLDPQSAADFDSLLLSLRESMGLTVCMVTHDLDSLYTVCDRVAVLADKKIHSVGTLQEMLANKHPWIHQYFWGPRGRAVLHSSPAADELSRSATE